MSSVFDKRAETKSALRIVNGSIVLTSLLVIVFALLRPNGSMIGARISELIPLSDSRLQLLVLPILATLGLVIRRIDQILANQVLFDISLGIFALVIVVSNAMVRQPHSTYPGFWSGFGSVPTAIALVLSLSLALLPAQPIAPLLRGELTRILTLVLFPLLLVSPALLLFVQPPNGLINLGDATYHVLDELLAPATGSLPYGEYTPQYSGVLGWILFPLRVLPMSGDSLLTVTLWMGNLMNLATALLVVSICRLMLPRLRRVPVFVAFVALWTACGPELGYSTQIREFSQFGRFLPSLVALLLVTQSVRNESPKQMRIRAVIAGGGLAFATLNSADHGLTLSLAVLATLGLLWRSKQVSTLVLTRIYMAFMMSLLGYGMILYVSAQPLSLRSYLGLRVEAVSNQVYDNSWLVSLGPHILILFIPMSLIALSSKGDRLYSSQRSRATQQFFAVAVSTWLIILLGKYLMSPLAVGLRYQFIPAFLGGIGILSFLDFSSLSLSSISTRIRWIPMLFVASLTFGSLYPFPNVSDEVRRISGRFTNTNDWSTTPGRPADGWTRVSINDAEYGLVTEVQTQRDRYAQRGLSVAYFGAFGKTIEVLTGTKSVLGLAAAESLRFGTAQARLACVPVTRFKPDVIITYVSELPCPGYTKDITASIWLGEAEIFATYLKNHTSGA